MSEEYKSMEEINDEEVAKAFAEARVRHEKFKDETAVAIFNAAKAFQAATKNTMDLSIELESKRKIRLALDKILTLIRWEV